MFAKIINAGETPGERAILEAAKKSGLLTGGDGIPSLPDRDKVRRDFGVIPMDIMDVASPNPTEFQRAIVRTSNASTAEAVVLITRTRNSEAVRALSALICKNTQMVATMWGGAEICRDGSVPFMVVYEDEISWNEITIPINAFMYDKLVSTIYLTASDDLLSPKNVKLIIKGLVSMWKMRKAPRPANRPPKQYK